MSRALFTTTATQDEIDKGIGGRSLLKSIQNDPNILSWQDFGISRLIENINHLDRVKKLHNNGKRCFYYCRVSKEMEIVESSIYQERSESEDEIVKEDKQLQKYIENYEIDHQLPVFIRYIGKNFASSIILRSWEFDVETIKNLLKERKIISYKIPNQKDK